MLTLCLQAHVYPFPRKVRQNSGRQRKAIPTATTRLGSKAALPRAFITATWSQIVAALAFVRAFGTVCLKLCNASHYTPAELLGKIVPDEHVHATCYNLQDKGLVVISSCGHVCIVNSVRQAQEFSGVRKIHAIVGGFHRCRHSHALQRH